ncbi:DinB family protein [uncultured Jatrophihabitans sp.]|uniref:DinB family protein n=1 Tax=uncultured Jatrophihabitans sp. TaxID=1610747 RepID=UPI0035CAB480
MRDFDIANDATPERWTQATVHRDMWADAAEDPREMDVVECVDERSTLLDYLRRYRLTLGLKCAELDPEQLTRRAVPPSTMSLLGLVRHMAGVEWHWFRNVMAGEDGTRPFRIPEDRDWEFNGVTAEPECVREAMESWHAEIAFAQQYVDGQDDLATHGAQTGDDAVQLRDILVHMIEEYARHCGHADLLRERIDGRVGQ